MSGVVLWEGLSRIDGAPIVAIMTGLGRGSSNPKTGSMLQTWIIRADLHPSEALATGADVSICGGCTFRPKSFDGVKSHGRGCYVNIMAPAAVYRAYKAGRYKRVDSVETLVTGRHVRFGAYGDPAAVPVKVWRELARYARGYTGYSHQWRNPKLRDVMAYCMASVETDADVARAQRLGFGTFRVTAMADTAGTAITCPASAEAGKIAQCITCGMCDGTARNITIAAHGTTVMTARRSLPVLTA